MEKIQNSALRVVFNDYDADYIQPLVRTIMFARRTTYNITDWSIQVYPKFMDMAFTLNNEPYDARSLM